jgi:Zn-dependent peptidase ImmA (M78 family)
MSVSACAKLGAELVRRFGSRDPFVIADGLGIHIYEAEFKRLKGMYRVIKRRRCIFLNAALDEETARIVCAHEIGHDRLHRDLARGDGLQEFVLYDMTSRPEYEANQVAAAILLSDEEVLHYVYDYGYDAEQIAKILSTDVNLVALKIDALREAGHPFGTVEHDTGFLK